jgi:hypothetical protein
MPRRANWAIMHVVQWGLEGEGCGTCRQRDVPVILNNVWLTTRGAKGGKQSIFLAAAEKLRGGVCRSASLAFFDAQADLPMRDLWEGWVCLFPSHV